MARSVPAGGVLRVARGAAWAGCSTALAAAAHAAGGGGWPDAGLVVLVMVLLAAGGAGLARRRRSLPGILGVLAATQVALHFLLGIAGAHHAVPGHALFWPGWGMLAAHAVAVLVTALVLTKAEAAVFAVVAALARLVPRPLVLALADPPSDPVIAAESVDRAVRVLLRRVCPTRGPPSCC